jgi:hypothetical protein
MLPIIKLIDLEKLTLDDILAEDKTKPLYARTTREWTPEEIAVAVKQVKHSPAFDNILDLGYSYSSTPQQEKNGTLIFNHPLIKKQVPFSTRWTKALKAGKQPADFSSESKEPMQYGVFATGYLRKLRAEGSTPAQNIAIKDVKYDHCFDMYKGLMRDLLNHLKRIKALTKRDPSAIDDPIGDWHGRNESLEANFDRMIIEGSLNVGTNVKKADDFEAYLKKAQIKYKRKGGLFEFDDEATA